MRWVDTFVHAFGQSQISHTGDFIAFGAIDQVHQKTLARIFIRIGKQSGCIRIKFSGTSSFMAITYSLYLAFRLSSAPLL